MATQDLLFCLSGSFDEEAVMRVFMLVQGLAKLKRVWPLGPPVFVDEIDSESMTSPDDLPIRTVGGLLPLHAPSSELAPDDDRRDLDAVRKLMDNLCTFSEKTGLEFELQLGPNYVGRIVGGIADDSIRRGLIEEWAKHLPQ